MKKDTNAQNIPHNRERVPGVLVNSSHQMGLDSQADSEVEFPIERGRID